MQLIMNKAEKYQDLLLKVVSDTFFLLTYMFIENRIDLETYLAHIKIKYDFILESIQSIE